MSLELNKITLDKRILNLSLEVAAGQIVGVLGPNGAGKTSFLRVIGCLDRPTAGCFLWNQENLLELDPSIRARKVAYLGSEYFSEFPMTVREAISLGRLAWGASEEGEEAIQKALHESNLLEFGDRNIQTLSGGELQRVALARVLAQGPELYILDESLSRMDIDFQVRSIRVLRNRINLGALALLVSHDMNFLFDVCDSVLLIENGGLKIFGKKNSPDVLQALQETFPQPGLRFQKTESGIQIRRTL